MTALETPPSLLKQIWWRLQPVQAAAFTCSGFDDLEHAIPPDVRSFVEDSYPHNHTYTAAGDRLLPKRKLATRMARLTRFYPTPTDSLLDLSCSKGFFVFHAAAQPGCTRALGVDLDDTCLNACRLLNERYSRQSQVAFVRTTIPELAERIDEFGGPFRVALLVNTYQYLVFGSSVAPPVSRDHREIFRLLRQLCSGRLIFHNRLELADLQSEPQFRASHLVRHVRYDRETIFAAASEFFEVRRLDPWSRRPVWLLDAR